MPPASLVASLLLSLSNFNLSCSSCIRYLNSLYCSNMESLALLLIWRHEYLCVLPSASVKTVHCRDTRYHTWTQSVSFSTAYSGVVIFLVFFIFSTFFLLDLLVSCSHLFLFPFFFEFRSFSSCVCPFSSCHILISAVSYVRNKLFQVLALFFMVINYLRRMWSSANCRGKIGEN
jgi:hypothetical protein